MANGGKIPERPVMNYQPPTGRASSTSGPGLGGDNYGNGQQPVCRDRPTGSPGIGGTNHGNCGSQGKR